MADGEMTQAELANRIGVTRQTVIAIEQRAAGLRLDADDTEALSALGRG